MSVVSSMASAYNVGMTREAAVPVPANRSVDQSEWLFAERFTAQQGTGAPMWRLYVDAFPDDPDVQPLEDESGSLHWPASVRARARRRAHEVLGRPNVQAVVAQIREDARACEEITLEGHLRKLAELRDQAAERGQLAAAISAEEKRGRAAGFYVERHIVQQDSKSPEQLLEELNLLIRRDPALAAVLADQMPVEVVAQPDGTYAQPGGESDDSAPDEKNLSPGVDSP